MTLLQVEGVDTAYGAVSVNHGVSLTVGAGEIVTIIGPNGAGKTTILRAISGLLRPGAGRIRFDGEDVTGTPADRMAALGVVMSPEGRRIFADLTVRENLRLGAYVRRDAAGIEADMERMEATFPILAQKRRQKGGSLSGGQQQMLAIARGLMANPKVLILDEPSLGLAPVVIKDVRQVIRDVRDTFGAAVLLVEQNASLALAVAERGYLMQHGRIVAEGTIEKLRGTALMRELYFGDSRATETV
jgi:branched-chain amino acid transport system ATP-binding protein